MATTLLHESYHAWGYYANPKGKDWADEWAGVYMACIMRTNAWKRFLASPAYSNIKKLATREQNER